jgi:hypothetical protein
MGTEPSTLDVLRARVAGDIEKWRSVVAKAGIQTE